MLRQLPLHLCHLKTARQSDFSICELFEHYLPFSRCSDPCVHRQNSSNVSHCMPRCNRAMDVSSASLSVAGAPLVKGVQYSLGSPWKPVSTAQQTFVASDASQTVIASAPFTPPNAPEAFTTFLLGDKTFGYSLLPQVDAPETGPCKPSTIHETKSVLS